MSPTRRIIVGVSGSLRNIAAVTTAAQLAADANADLIAVMTWQSPGGEQVARRSPCPELDAACRQRAAEALIETLEGIPLAVSVSALVLRGQPGPRLVEYANSSADTLVIGAGRRRPWKRALWSPVARYCSSHAQCPLLTVPEPALLSDGSRRRPAWPAANWSDA